MLVSRAGLIFLLCCLIGLTHAQTVHNAEWLLRQDPKAFTLQLVTLSNADQASRMAQQHNLPEALARFRIQGQNQLLYVLTYGVFREAAQAERRRAAIAVLWGLPPEQLWVRQMESVQRAIRTTLQQ